MDVDAFEIGTTGGGLTTGDRNIFYGHRAGIGISAGSGNVILGTGAGQNFVGSDGNVIIGQFAGSAGLTPDGLGGYIPPIQVSTGQDDLVIIGNLAGQFNTGPRNVFIGREAGRNNTTANDSTFLGYRAGKFNTTGNDSTFMGSNSGLSNTSGSRNTGIGNHAAASNDTGFDNTALGAYALSGSYTGGSTPRSDDSYSNTAIGARAGDDVGFPFTGGDETTWSNTFVGAYSGYDVGGGRANSMFGAHAGLHTEHADYNTFVGAFAGFENNRTNQVSRANRNTYVGLAAGQLNRRGEDNVIIGALADFRSWENATEAELTAAFDHMEATESNLDRPALIGSVDTSGGHTDVNRVITIGSYATTRRNDGLTIGYSADTLERRSITIGTGAQNTHADAIVIGHQATSQAANTAVIGNATTVGWNPGADGVTALGSSTMRFSNATAQGFDAIAGTGADASVELYADNGTSNNDRWLVNAADGGDFTISSFSTGSYVPGFTLNNVGDVVIPGEVRMNSDERQKQKIEPITNARELVEKLEGKTYEWKSAVGRAPGRHYGLIAQQVETVVPEVVSEDKEGAKSVSYQSVVPILVEAVKELSAENRALRSEIEVLKNATGTGENIQGRLQELELMIQEQSDRIGRVASGRD